MAAIKKPKPGDRNDGKFFEHKVQLVLNEYKKRSKSFHLRLYDTTSASRKGDDSDQEAQLNFLPAQPGDNILLQPGIAVLIECKSSTKHESLRSCVSSMVDPAQAASHRLWQRAGHPSTFLFCDLVNDIVECWNGVTVAMAKAQSKPMKLEDRLFTCKLRDLVTAFDKQLQTWRN
jgi:hypothetical protein